MPTAPPIFAALAVGKLHARPTLPDGVPVAMDRTIRQCWHDPDPACRPTFDALDAQLSQLDDALTADERAWLDEPHGHRVVTQGACNDAFGEQEVGDDDMAPAGKACKARWSLTAVPRPATRRPCHVPTAYCNVHHLTSLRQGDSVPQLLAGPPRARARCAVAELASLSYPLLSTVSLKLYSMYIYYYVLKLRSYSCTGHATGRSQTSKGTHENCTQRVTTSPRDGGAYRGRVSPPTKSALARRAEDGL